MIATNDFSLATSKMLAIEKGKPYFTYRLYWRSDKHYHDLLGVIGNRIRDVLIKKIPPTKQYVYAKDGNFEIEVTGWHLDYIEFQSTLKQNEMAGLISQFIDSKS